MKERPILFSAPMVRALLAGTKTQTRRVANKPVRHPDLGNLYTLGALVLAGEPHHVIERACPYGQPSDRLWVREAWAHARHAASANCVEDGPFVYAADGKFAARERLNPRWVPGIHMFRWASRIMLEITGVRAERLQDISEADAVAEGLTFSEAARRSRCCMGIYELKMPDGKTHFDDNACVLYRKLWQQINGPGSWAANPWLWVVEFKRVTP